MAEILNVSKSGFNAYLNRPKSKREIANDELLEKIKAIHKRNHGIYGYPNITKELEKHGAPSKNRVYRLMRKNGIKSKTVRKFKATTNSNHNLPVAGNLLNREFTAKAKPKMGKRYYLYRNR